MTGARFAFRFMGVACIAAPVLAQDINHPAAGAADRASPPAVAASGAAAQQAAAPLTRGGSGPTLATAAVGVHAAKTEAAPVPAPPRRVENNRNVAMMIVGGAALVIGAVIDKPAGTIVMLGGAGIGLYGLYKYLE